MSILIFLLVLFVLVLVHELGHFVVAKLTRMRVDEFGIGFPPRLFGIRKGETVYSMNALPIGGFVKIRGEDAIDAGADLRAFTAKSKWAQAATLVAGVVMNILLAWVLFTVVFTAGVQTSVTETEATPDAALTVTSVLADSPASAAGVPAGAHITALDAAGDSLEVLTPATFQQFVETHDAQTLSLTYVVHGDTHTAELTPQEGLIADAPTQPVVGIALSLVDVVSRPIHVAMYEATKLTYTTLRDITVGVGMLAWNALRFQADFSQVAGPVGIVGLVGEASAFGFTALLMFTAFISLNLAIINLLPFPALDGGRLLFVAIEAVKGSPIDPRWVGALNTAGFALLILLMIAVTVGDVVRIL